MVRPYLCVVTIAGFLLAPAAFAAGTPCTSFANGPEEAFVLKLDPAAVYVTDGDTIKEQKKCERLRLSDVDTPETDGSRCVPEKDFADKATVRLTALIRAAKVLEFHYSGTRESYNRPFGRLVIDGKSAGEILRSEGLGCPYSRDVEHDWCATPPKCLSRPKQAAN